MLAAILFTLVTALVTRSFLPLPLAALMLLVDTGRTWHRMNLQRLPLGPVEIFAARTRAIGSLAYYLGYHLLRYYLLPLLAVTLVYPPFVLPLMMTLLGVATVDHQVRRARLLLPLFCGFYFLEQLAYGSGVFWGCLRTRSFASYRLNLQAD